MRIEAPREKRPPKVLVVFEEDPPEQPAKKEKYGDIKGAEENC
jgi:hypothetical protein